MAPNRPADIRHFVAPLSSVSVSELMAFLQHKETPWVADIQQRACGELAGAEDHFFTATVADRIVGHCWYTVQQDDPRIGLVGHIFTHADMRRQGIATQLLTQAQDEFRARGGSLLQLFTSTPFSVPCYERCGFENVFSQSVHHEQDWYMTATSSANTSSADRATWFAGEPPTLRPLAPGDLPQYSLLYNSDHQYWLKDRAQQIGLGLEAEWAFITIRHAIAQRRAICFVLDNGQAIVGVATLCAASFPHQKHLGIFDIYTVPSAAAYRAQLAERCVQAGLDEGIDKIYAIVVDSDKRKWFPPLGFASRTFLRGHYRIGTESKDAELFEYAG